MERGAPRLSVIVVSWNTRDMTLACLRSLRGQTTCDHELIVVDNASTDGSAEALAEMFPDGADPRVRLMLETENHGFAKANNIAAARASGDLLLLLNPDTLVLDHAVDRLLAFAEARPEARIWGGRTFYGDMSLNPTSCWRRMTLWSLLCRTLGLTGVFRRSEIFNPEAFGDWDRGEEREVDIVTGCFMMLPREMWNRLGGFDETYVMYGEEADLCLRARALGAAPRITPDARIVHYGGASEKIRSDKVVRILRAKTTLVRRHFSALTRGPGVVLIALWPLTRTWAGRAARLLGARDVSDAWEEVWRRRREWLAGYPERAPE